MGWAFLDSAFIVFHSSLILFNLFGWIVRRTRRLNFITLMLTGFSWTVPGIFYGFGYCPLTDWHWKVLIKLGEPTPHTSYIGYLLERTLGLSLPSGLVDHLTLALFLVSLGASGYMNFFAQKRKNN